MKRTGENIVILLFALVLFAGGVWALSMDRGDGRTITLGCIVGAMLCLAVLQSLRRLKKK